MCAMGYIYMWHTFMSTETNRSYKMGETSRTWSSLSDLKIWSTFPHKKIRWREPFVLNYRIHLINIVGTLLVSETHGLGPLQISNFTIQNSQQRHSTVQCIQKHLTLLDCNWWAAAIFMLFKRSGGWLRQTAIDMCVPVCTVSGLTAVYMKAFKINSETPHVWCWQWYTQRFISVGWGIHKIILQLLCWSVHLNW